MTRGGRWTTISRRAVALVVCDGRHVFILGGACFLTPRSNVSLKGVRVCSCNRVRRTRLPTPSESVEQAACTLLRCCSSVFLSVITSLGSQCTRIHMFNTTRYTVLHTDYNSTVAGILLTWHDRQWNTCFFGFLLVYFLLNAVILNLFSIYFRSFLSAYSYFCLKMI